MNEQSGAPRPITSERTWAVSDLPMDTPFVIVFSLLLAFGLGLLALTSISDQQTFIAPFLPLHTAIEFISILASFMVFTVGWATYAQVQSASVVYLAVSSFAVGLLDLAHTLSYEGMPTFISQNSTSKAIAFWLLARFTMAATLVVVPFIPITRRLRYPRSLLMAGAVAWVAFCYWLVLYRPDLFPETFVPGRGLTAFKIGAEFFIVGLFLTAGFIYLLRSAAQGVAGFRWLAYACFVLATSDVLFGLYTSMTDLTNFIGHLYKGLGSILIYRAVFVECVLSPYQGMRNFAQELRIANETKIHFLANVSHEIRTPLGVIFGFSDLLLGSAKIHGEEREWLGIVKRNAEQLKLLIDDLLDLTKAETGQLATQKERFSLQEVVDDVTASMNLPAQQKAVSLRFHKAEALPNTLNNDPMRLRQILVNLIGNAIKFTEKGSVEVSFEMIRREWSGERLLKVSVSDTGLGITPEQAQRLFRPFSQGDPSMTRRFGGTGLGLALSRKLANSLGGDLWLEKSQPGKGSTFCFTISSGLDAERIVAVTTEPSKSTGPELPPPASPLQGISILVVDDSQENRFLITRYLTSCGATVDTAANGALGVELARTGRFHFIFMDIQMPEMDGYTATKVIREQALKIPVVALTAHALQTEKDRALNSGFNGYLTKPVSKKALVDTVLATLSEGESRSVPPSQ